MASVILVEAARIEEIDMRRRDVRGAYDEAMRIGFRKWYLSDFEFLVRLYRSSVSDQSSHA